jgi:hypothetical protein
MGSGSGPPQPDCRNEHVAIFANEIVVTGVMAKNHNGVRYSTDQSMRASQEREHLGLWRDAYWSTNASRITVDGHLVYAPFTGRLVMTPFDKSYSLEDFRKLAQSLTDAMRAAFPDRLVYAPIYEGSKQ